MRELAGNRSAEPSELMSVVAPYDGERLAQLECTSPKQLESYLATAYSLFRDRDRWLPLAERIGVLDRAARIMLRDRNRLALDAAQEGGKPLLDSQLEVECAIDALKLAVECLRSDSGELVPMQTTKSSAHRIALTQKEPVGVVAAVSAFNHPLNLVAHQTASAIAAGCPVIVKPSPDTPLSCLNFVKILREAGLSESWCRVLVTEDLGLVEALVTDPRIGLLSFIGSPEVGWALRSKLAPGVRCTLEHGGAAPVIVAEDADWEITLRKLTKGAFYHAGQLCVSVQRIFVPREQSIEFAAELGTRAAALRLGDPRSSVTDVGPLIRPAEVSRVHEWVEQALSDGAVLITGGKASGRSGYQPTVLLDPPPDAMVSTREIFGPVACVYAYDSLDEAIEKANHVPFALHAAVFTSDIDRALRVYRRLDASAIMLNDDTTFRVDGMPFTGTKQSGLGSGGIRNSINEMRIDKMLVLNSPQL